MIEWARRSWRRATGPLHEFGFVDGAVYVVGRVLRGRATGLYVYDLMAQPIGGHPLLAPNRLKNMRFAPIGRGHPDIDRMPARDDIKAQRFEQGAECLGAYRNEVLIGFVWFSTPVYEEDEVRCTFQLVQPERSVFDFDMYVFPEYRMGTAFMAVWHGANALLHERGVAYTFSRVSRFNAGSRRAHMQLGAVRIGVASFLKLWRLEAMVASVAPWIALSWGASQRVVLRLAPPDVQQQLDASNGGPSVEQRSGTSP